MGGTPQWLNLPFTIELLCNDIKPHAADFRIDATC
jgi:hypothetical protein